MVNPTERITLVSNKVPKPTNFSNIRSHQYLAHPDNIPALFSQELLKSLPRNNPLNKFIINLDQLIKLEEVLNYILEVVNEHRDVRSYVRDWWELSSLSTLTRLHTIFKDKRTKETLKNAFRLEAMAIALAENYDEISLESESLLELLKELLFSIHQNYLVIVSIALHRLPASSSTNNWAVTLQTIIHNKRMEKIKKTDNVNYLERQNVRINDMLKQIVNEISINESSYTLKGILLACSQILKDIESFEVDTVREVLHTASLNEPEHIPLNTTESLDLDGELPKVDPPYLPPLENENTYTLVLDLDETLIHYYESGNEGHYLIRPGCDEFLKEMSECYEVVIFTAALQEVVNM